MSAFWNILLKFRKPQGRIAIGGGAPVPARGETAARHDLWPVGHSGAGELASAKKAEQKDVQPVENGREEV